MYILYDFVFLVFAVVYLPYLILTHRYHSRIMERFGIFSKDFFKGLKGKEVIWLHAVSVGEIMAASPLIKQFHQRFGSHKLLISTVTKTANGVAARIKRDEDFLIYFPLDLSFVIKKVLNKIRPKIFIIMETEIWPNIITAFYKEKIPIILINGRLSQHSFKAYKKVKVLLKNIFRRIGLFCMQTAGDAVRLKELGIEENKIKVTGNMKYDVPGIYLNEQINKIKLSLGIGNDKKILIAGSTHRGEDQIILNAYKGLLRRFLELRLIIAPRHIERTEEIEHMVSRCNLKSKRFSSATKDFKDAEVIILDVMGKLKDLYAISDIVFIGGSLLPRYGGHNLLEPAAFKKPIIFGPYMTNFKDMASKFLEENAAIQVKTKADIEKVCSELLNSAVKMERLGRAAFDIVEKNKGATERNLKYIENIMASGVIDR